MDTIRVPGMAKTIIARANSRYGEIKTRIRLTYIRGKYIGFTFTIEQMGKFHHAVNESIRKANELQASIDKNTKDEEDALWKASHEHNHGN